MILYRFERADLFRVDTLKQGKIWLSRPKQFNDPFDCTLKIRAPEDTAAVDIQQLKLAVRQLYPTYASQSSRWLFDEAILSDIRAWINSDNDHAVPDFIRKIEERVQRFGVECFTEILDNPLMWGYYTSAHRGFCIAYECDSARIAAANPEFSLDPIVYHSRLPEFEVSEVLLCPAQVQRRLYSTKAIHWAHEREYRLIHFNFQPGECDGQQVDLPEGMRIKAIYLGLKTADYMVQQLVGAARELGVNIFKMHVKSHGDYELCFEQLS